MTARDLLGPAKQGYVATARATGRVLARTGLLSEEPPPLDHRVRHWLRSLVLVHDSLAIARLDVPWWTYDAIAEVQAWLDRRPGEIRVFEYGSGASTLWLSRRAAEVHSVEHHAGFAAMMQQELAGLDHVTLRVVEPVAAASPRVASSKEGHQGLDFTEYVSTIEEVPGDFDLVVVDGRARASCLAAAVPRLAPGGLVVFDNSGRRRYRAAISGSGLVESRHRGLTPTLPYPEQTSLLRRG